MTDRELLEYIAAQVGVLTKDVDDIKNENIAINSKLNSMDSRFDSMDSRLDSMDSRFESMDSRFESMDSRLESMDTNITNLKTGQDKIENRINEIEHQNETNHNHIIDSIDELNSNLSQIEMVTANNWSDIAKIKAKKRRTK